MIDFLKLCNRSEYPESRKIIEGTFRNLGLTEQEKEQLFRDFSEIFSGEEKDLKIVFDEFIKIFLSEVIKNCGDSDWKYRVWMQLKQHGEQKILLESFEEVLNFDVKEEKWFRGSPFWIDLEKSRIYRRKEVDIIKKKLKKKNIQIVFGEAASGKSAIVKYIGYEYCKQPKPVYLINLKTDSLELYKEDIVNLLDRNGLLIIEDAHLAFHDVNWVVSKAFGRRLKVLVSTRPLEGVIIPRESTRFEELIDREENVTKIEAINGAEGIVRFYFSQMYGEKKEGEYEEVIKELFSKYGRDLWLLSFALDAYSSETRVDMKRIYESICEKYLKRIQIKKNKFVRDSYRYLHPICVLYQYEIPVYKEFLRKDLDLNEMYLNELIETGEILQKERLLLLQHRSRAKYFLEAMITCGFYTKKDEFTLIRKYILSCPEFACNVIVGIAKYWYNKGDLFKDFISDPELLEGVVRGIDKAKNLMAIGSCLLFIEMTNQNLEEKICKEIEIDILVGKIDMANLDVIGFCLSQIASANREVARFTVEKMNIERIIREIDITDFLPGIGFCLSGIAEADITVAKEILNDIDMEKLAKRININNLSEIIQLFSTINKINKNIQIKILELLSPDKKNEIMRFFGDTIV